MGKITEWSPKTRHITAPRVHVSFHIQELERLEEERTALNCEHYSLDELEATCGEDHTMRMGSIERELRKIDMRIAGCRTLISRG